MGNSDTEDCEADSHQPAPLFKTHEIEAIIDLLKGSYTILH